MTREAASVSCRGLVLAGLLVVLGCGGRDDAPPSGGAANAASRAVSVALAKAKLIPLGRGAPRMDRWEDHQDSLQVAVVPLSGGSLRIGPMRLEQAYTLEFLPVVSQGGQAAGRMVKVRLEADGESVELAAVPAIEIARVGPPERVAMLREPVRIDLASFVDRLVMITWTWEGDPAASANAGVAALRLVPARRVKRPHVLFVCSDTHRADHAFGPLGGELMPRLQDLRARSVLYRKAYSSASWTLPSIATSLTGRFPRFHLTGKLIERRPSGEKRVAQPPGQFVAAWAGTEYVLSTYPATLETLPERLRDAGYRTLMVASNYFYSVSGIAADGSELVYATGAVPGDVINTAARDLVEAAGTDEPIFLLVHYMDAHEYVKWPYQPAPSAVRAAGSADGARYRARVRDVDRHLHDLLTWWDERLGVDESLVVFYADHGEELGERQPGLIGHGGSMREELLRVPLLVHYPRGMGLAGVETDARAALVDLVPTTLETAGLAPGGQLLDGRSLVGLARGEGGQRDIFADFQLYGDELSSVRREDYKLVIDLTHDARTLSSTSGSALDPAVEQSMTSALQASFDTYAMRASTETADVRSDQAIDQQEVTRRLQALGYVE